jgi:hypothetical protein
LHRFCNVCARPLKNSKKVKCVGCLFVIHANKNCASRIIMFRLNDCFCICIGCLSKLPANIVKGAIECARFLSV